MKNILCTYDRSRVSPINQMSLPLVSPGLFLSSCSRELGDLRGSCEKYVGQKNPKYYQWTLHEFNFITKLVNTLAERNKKCGVLILGKIKKLDVICKAVRKNNTLLIFFATRGIDLGSPVKVWPLVIACPHCSQQGKFVISKGISKLLKINF